MMDEGMSLAATVSPGIFNSGGGGGTVVSDSGISIVSQDPEVFQRAGASRALIHQKVPNGYEPTTDWFAAHKYYTPGAINGFTQGQLSQQAAYKATRGPMSVTTGSGGGGADGLNNSKINSSSGGARGSGAHEDPTGFFPSASTVAKKNNEELQQVCERYENRETSNLSALHAMLYPLVTHEGKISVEHVKKVVQGIAVPGANVADYVMVWFMHLGIPIDGALPYDDVMSGLYELFNGSGANKTADACFKLCDITNAKFILRDQIVGLKPKVMSQQEEQHEKRSTSNGGGMSMENEAGGGEAGGVGAANVELPSEHLTYLVVKAVLRCFEHVAVAEEERVRLAQMKGKKKKKKNQVVVMPTKRQFHISSIEFKGLLQRDPHLVVAFLPYAMLISTEV